MSVEALPVGALVGIMGLLTVICVYFWLVRAKPEQTTETKS